MKSPLVTLALGALLVPTAGDAFRPLLLQPLVSEVREIPLAILYDFDSTTITYCRTLGEGGNVLGGSRAGGGRVETSGASTTVSAVNASTEEPFTNVGVGDVVYFRAPVAAAGVSLNQTLERVVTAKASNDSITIGGVDPLSNTANVNLDIDGGISFTYRDLECGTTITAGWVPTKAYRPMKFSIAVNQMTVDAGGINQRWECREEGADAQPFQVYPSTGYTNDTSSTIASRHAVGIGLGDPWAYCRVGVAVPDDDATDTGAAAEAVTIRAVLQR